ncbi:MAG: Glutamyl aminopeptidase [Firmicutes bacterium ADurb.Bin182]|nr:MAG: Glutamyl aminopeptidase [Firmicutes bacterium ADurb.Bin182]
MKDFAQRDYILEKLKALLDIPSPSGFTGKVADYLMEELAGLGYRPYKTVKGGVAVKIGGGDSALMLSAHVDTLGAMVAAVKPNGRLRISPVGGLQANNTEAENCTVYTRSGKAYSGTLQMNDPSVHVNKEYGSQKRDYEGMEVVLDEITSSKEETEKLGIFTGDYVCFDPRTVITETGFIKSRYLDDKLSAAILLGLARQHSERRYSLKRGLYLHFTVYEEVGHGCSASMPEDVTEILCVDMGCVGDGLNCDERKVSICVKDSSGPSNYEMTGALIDCAKRRNLEYALDVYPYYGSDADSALYAGHDVRHCLIGAGVYASHGYERSHIDGVKNTLELIEAYITE